MIGLVRYGNVEKNGRRVGRKLREILSGDLGMASRAQDSGDDTVLQLDRIRTCWHASRCVGFF